MAGPPLAPIILSQCSRLPFPAAATRSVRISEMTDRSGDTHLLSIGYLIWIFGFLGSHRFYFGRPISGTIWFLTLGLLGIGWLVDLFLIPSMERDAEQRYRQGPIDYTLAWICLTFFGLFGLHRFYLGKWPTAILYLLSAGLLGFGILYDFWTLNEQVDDANA